MSVAITVERGDVVRTYEIAASTPLAGLAPVLVGLDGFLDAFPLPLSFPFVELPSGECMARHVLLKEAGEDATIGMIGAVKLVGATQPPEQVELRIYDTNDDCISAIHPSAKASATDVLRILDVNFEGALADSTLEYNGKTEGVLRELKNAFTTELDTPLIDRITNAITALPPLLQPAPPKSLGDCFLTIKESVSLRAQADDEGEVRSRRQCSPLPLASPISLLPSPAVLSLLPSPVSLLPVCPSPTHPSSPTVCLCSPSLCKGGRRC